MVPVTEPYMTVLPGAPMIDIAMECRVGESQLSPEIEWFRTSGGITTQLIQDSAAGIHLLEGNRWIYIQNVQNFADTYHCEVANALVHQQMRSPETFSVDENGLMDGQRFVYKRIGNLTAFSGDEVVISYISSNGLTNLQGVFDTQPAGVGITTLQALGTIPTVPSTPATIMLEWNFGDDILDTGLLTVFGGSIYV